MSKLGNAAAKVFAVLAVILAQSAVAADMPAKAPAYKAPMAVATPWTGFYVNGGVGYGMWAADTTISTAATGVCFLCETQVQGGKGWLGTIGAGYDYQFTPRIVGGVFGDVSVSNLKGTIQNQFERLAGDITQTSSWAFGARAGWLVTPQTMSYLNAGYTGARFSGTNLVSMATGAPAPLSTPAFTASGWFLGGGVETAVSPGWFWRTEYRYAYYGSKSVPELGPGAVFNINFRPTVQTVTTQVVYKFNGGLPTPVYPAIAAVPTNWTGIYVNAGVGYGVWTADTQALSAFNGQCVFCKVEVQGGKGYLGRIGAGYDWQFAPAWVTGVFGDFDISSLKGTIQDAASAGGFLAAASTKQTSAWAAGARLGWLPSPQTMTYVNGGYTGARFSNPETVSTFSGTPSGFFYPANFTTSGWFVGGGVETTFDLLGKGWFWRNEYRYASYASRSLPDISPAFGANSSIAFKPAVQTVVSAVVFKFN